MTVTTTATVGSAAETTAEVGLAEPLWLDEWTDIWWDTWGRLLPGSGVVTTAEVD